MAEWKLTPELIKELEDIERREDLGEDVWGLRAAIEASNRATAARVQEVKALPVAIRGKSQKERAILLYNTLTNKSRKAVIDALVEQLNMKKVTASTYASNLVSERWK